jgi:hypothetical protein
MRGRDGTESRTRLTHLLEMRNSLQIILLDLLPDPHLPVLLDEPSKRLDSTQSGVNILERAAFEEGRELEGGQSVERGRGRGGDRGGWGRWWYSEEGLKILEMGLKEGDEARKREIFWICRFVPARFDVDRRIEQGQTARLWYQKTPSHLVPITHSFSFSQLEAQRSPTRLRHEDHELEGRTGFGVERWMGAEGPCWRVDEGFGWRVGHDVAGLVGGRRGGGVGEEGSDGEGGGVVDLGFECEVVK